MDSSSTWLVSPARRRSSRRVRAGRSTERLRRGDPSASASASSSSWTPVDDHELARLIASRGLLPWQQAMECLTELARQQERDPELSLARFLIERSLLSPSTVQELAIEATGDGSTLAPLLARTSDEQELPARMPSEVGGYRVERLLSRGGMGTVYVATSPAGEQVALKTVRTAAGPRRREELMRFRREVEVIAALDHPYIVKIRDFEVDGPVPYLVEELLPGGSLQDRIDRAGPLPLVGAVKTLSRLCEAVAHAHRRGILHRDLKPRNVLFRADGSPCLVDFGLARGVKDVDTRLTTSGEVVGTPAYMAPEQARGDALDERADVYGLGALFYAMLCGRPPYLGRPVEILDQVASAPLFAPPRPGELRDDVPATVEAVLLTAMAATPSERYPGPAALAKALNGATTVRPPRPSKTGSAQPTRQPTTQPTTQPTMQPPNRTPRTMLRPYPEDVVPRPTPESTETGRALPASSALISLVVITALGLGLGALGATVARWALPGPDTGRGPARVHVDDHGQAWIERDGELRRLAPGEAVEVRAPSPPGGGND